MRLRCWIAGGFALLALARPARGQVTVVGDWHGVLQSPVGPMTLVVTITEGEKGVLRGELASPDQGPGRMPLATISVGRTPPRVHRQIGADPVRRGLGRGRAALVRHVHAERQDTADAPARPATRAACHRGARRPVAGSRHAKRRQSSPGGASRDHRSRHDRYVRFTGPWRHGPPGGRVLAARPGRRLLCAGVGRAILPASCPMMARRLTGLWTVPGQPDTEVAFVRTRATAERESRRTPADAEAAVPVPRGRGHVHEPGGRRRDPGWHVDTAPKALDHFPRRCSSPARAPRIAIRRCSATGRSPSFADHLARHGVAVVRYDDRGVGPIHRRVCGGDLGRLRHRCECRRSFPEDTARDRSQRDRIHRPQRGGEWWRKSPPLTMPTLISSSCSRRPAPT